jgi:hypothetical protein
LSQVLLIYLLFAFMLLGASFVVAVVFYKRLYFKGKIKCIFYTRSGRVEEKLLKPNKDNHMEWNEGHYLFVREFILLGTSAFGEGVPTLSFIEDNVHPITVDNYAANIGDVTARQLAADFDDKMARELSSVTQITDELVVQKEIKNLLFLGFAVLIIVNIGGFWMVNA